MQEDFALCQDIMTMRNYAELDEMEKRDPKSIKADHRRFMDAVEKMAGVR